MTSCTLVCCPEVLQVIEVQSAHDVRVDLRRLVQAADVAVSPDGINQAMLDLIAASMTLRRTCRPPPTSGSAPSCSVTWKSAAPNWSPWERSMPADGLVTTCDCGQNAQDLVPATADSTPPEAKV